MPRPSRTGAALIQALALQYALTAHAIPRLGSNPVVLACRFYCGRCHDKTYDGTTGSGRGSGSASEAHMHDVVAC